MSLVRGSRVVTSTSLYRRVVRPDLKTVSLPVPVWSATQPTAITWTIENTQPVPLSGGTVRAVLAPSPSGVPLLDETRPLVLGEAPNGQGTVTFQIPPLPPGVAQGSLALIADTGLGRQISTNIAVRHGLVVSARSAALDYAAGDSGEVLVSLRNDGTILEGGSLTGTIDGMGALPEAPYALAPRTSTTLHLPFTVPPDVRSGRHGVVVGLPNGPPVATTEVLVRIPALLFSVPAQTFTAGQPVAITLRNVSGTFAQPVVTLSLVNGSAQTEPGTEVTSNVEVAPGTETTIDLPLPVSLPRGVYQIVGSAADALNGGAALLNEIVQVSGTFATLSVSTDKGLYVFGDSMQLQATGANGAIPLEGALLHVEVGRQCVSQAPPGESFHVATWDGSRWVERAVRHFPSDYETQLVDLAPYLPDPDNEYKVLITHRGDVSAQLDQLAVLSAGTWGALTTVESVEGLPIDTFGLLAGDDIGEEVTRSSFIARFNSGPSPSLVLRAREGASSCPGSNIWQQDTPLSLTTGEVFSFPFAQLAPSERGEYAFRGTLLTRNGAVLARSEAPFTVSDTSVSVSLRGTQDVYRRGAVIPLTVTVRNLLPEPLNLAVMNLYLVQFDEFGNAQHELLDGQDLEPVPAGGEESFSVDFDTAAAGLGLGEVHFQVQDFVGTASGFFDMGEVSWNARLDDAAITAELAVPDPAGRLVPAAPRLAATPSDADLDAVTHDPGGVLDGSLPFVLQLPSSTGPFFYDHFRQSVAGGVELLRNGFLDPPITLPGCLVDIPATATVLAPALGDWDPSAPGAVGYKRYAAGAPDGSGGVFARNTIVFYWHVFATDTGTESIFQLRLSDDGLIRLDAGALESAACPRSGVALAGGDHLPVTVAAPFGTRLETSVGRQPFTGSIRLHNTGGLPGSVTIDYGRLDVSSTTLPVTLSPGEARTIRFTDAITEDTTYRLSVTGDLTTDVLQTVTAGESFVATYTGQATLTPGPALLPFALRKDGGTAGPVTVVFTLAGAGTAQTVTRTYDLEPGLTTTDTVPFDLVEGTFVLSSSADVPLTTTPVALRAGPQERVALTVADGGLSGGVFTIGVDVLNSGLADFTGELQIDGPGGTRTPVSVVAGQTAHVDLPVDLAGQPPGALAVTVRLVSPAGVVVGEGSVTRTIAGPHVVIASSPAGTSFDANTIAPLRFVLQNTGDLPARGELTFSVFDFQRSASYDLAAGAQSEIAFDLPLSDDAETKTYSGLYAITTDGASPSSGQVNFIVNGISLAVTAALDKDAYADGDVAHLAVTVTSPNPAPRDFLVRTHYGSFEQTVPVTVAGTGALSFDIPLPQVTGEPVFLGISDPAGRSIYINTFHVRRADALLLLTVDQQVYTPGQSVAISGTAVLPGSVTLSAPGYSDTFATTGTVGRSFALPTDLPGGTYFVSWSFTAADGSSASGSVPFDVAGLRVRVLAADLDRGRYASGDTIASTLRINTNEATTATLRGFILDPDGGNTLVGEKPVALDPAQDLIATHEWPFASSTAGLHRLVYGIYRGPDTLLASGSMAFDVGSGAVLGVRMEKDSYPDPDAPVRGTVTGFVSGPVTLKVDVDGQNVSTQDVTTTGIVDVPVTLTGVLPGPHEVVATMEGGGYTSHRSTSFSLGTSLPDLVTGTATARAVTGSAWKIDIPVTNAGPAAAPATDLGVRDLGTNQVLGTGSVPGLAPGASVIVSLDWNVLGAAGDHTVEAAVDPAGAVREFRKDNNKATAILTVAALEIEAIAGDVYPANVQATLSGLVTNLSATDTFTGLAVVSTVTSPSGLPSLLTPASLGPLGPGAVMSGPTPWAVAQSAPGTYQLQTNLVASDGTVKAASLRLFVVGPTEAVRGTVSAVPNPISGGQSLSLGGTLQNQGNVSATGTARWDVVASNGTVSAQATILADVPVGASTPVSSTIAPLSSPPGDYRVDLSLDTASTSHFIASTPLTVGGSSVEASLASDTTPRVLALVGTEADAALNARRTAFVVASLSSTAAIVRTTADVAEFTRLARSGAWNTYLVMTEVPRLTTLMMSELRVAVLRGDGVVLVQWGEGSSTPLEPALQAGVVGLQSGTTHTLVLTDGPLGPFQTVTVPGSATTLDVRGATVLGATNGVPVVTVGTLGAGRTAVLALDVAVDPADPSRAAMEALLARAVSYTAPTQARSATAGRVLSFAFTVENKATTAQSVDIAAQLPAGVTAAGADDGATVADPPTWQVTLAPAETRRLRFSVVPTADGTFTISSRFQVGGVTRSPSPEAVFTVPRSTEAVLADVLAATQALTPGTARDQALAYLTDAQTMSADSTLLEESIRLAAAADAALGIIVPSPSAIRSDLAARDRRLGAALVRRQLPGGV